VSQRTGWQRSVDENAGCGCHVEVRKPIGKFIRQNRRISNYETASEMTIGHR
jgi:hypothetical protein